jgi:hypothetical protein
MVAISSIDEYGQPWFEYNLIGPGGSVEVHAVAIMDDESWCVA